MANANAKTNWTDTSPPRPATLDGDEIERQLAQPATDDTDSADEDMREGAKRFMRGFRRAAAIATLIASAGLSSCVSVESMAIGYNAETGSSEVRFVARRTSGKEVVAEPLPPMPQASRSSRGRVLSATAKRLMGLTP